MAEQYKHKLVVSKNKKIKDGGIKTYGRFDEGVGMDRNYEENCYKTDEICRTWAKRYQGRRTMRRPLTETGGLCEQRHEVIRGMTN